jgi:hypothetical protein
MNQDSSTVQERRLSHICGQIPGSCLRSLDSSLTIRIKHHEVLWDGGFGFGIHAGTDGSPLNQLQCMLLMQARQSASLAS